MHVASLKMMILCLVKVLKLKSFFSISLRELQDSWEFCTESFPERVLRGFWAPDFSEPLGPASSTRTTFRAARVRNVLAKSCSQRNITATLPIAGGFTSFQIWNDGGLCARFPASLHETKSWNCRNFHVDRFVCQEGAGSSIEPEWSHREHLRTRCGRSNSHISLTWSTTFLRTPSCGLSERFLKKDMKYQPGTCLSSILVVEFSKTKVFSNQNQGAPFGF